MFRLIWELAGSCQRVLLSFDFEVKTGISLSLTPVYLPSLPCFADCRSPTLHVILLTSIKADQSQLFVQGKGESLFLLSLSVPCSVDCVETRLECITSTLHWGEGGMGNASFRRAHALVP